MWLSGHWGGEDGVNRTSWPRSDGPSATRPWPRSCCINPPEADIRDEEVLALAQETYARDEPDAPPHLRPGPESRVTWEDGRQYAILRNRTGPLAVYLLQPGRALEELDPEQWPPVLEAE